MTKNKKESEILLDEIVKLHPILDKNIVKNWTDHELYKASEKFQEPRFLSYRLKRDLENRALKDQRKKFLQNKK